VLDQADACAAVSLVLDEPFLFQAGERGADERAAHSQGAGQVAFDQALVRLEAPGDNRFAELILGSERYDRDLIGDLVHRAQATTGFLPRSGL
jgi:hypothetical protein